MMFCLLDPVCLFWKQNLTHAGNYAGSASTKFEKSSKNRWFFNV